MKKKDDQHFYSLLEDIEPKIGNLKQINKEEAFKVMNFMALSLIKRGKYAEALKKYKNLQSETAKFYDYKFEGISLVHDIFRNMAIC